MSLNPYWIALRKSAQPSFFNLGVGITANSEADARELFAQTLGTDKEISNVRPLASVDELDQRHVVPNMGNWLKRGVWFPNL